MTYKRSFSLQLRLVETIEVNDETPSPLPPKKVVDTDGVLLSETIRPLAKVIPFVRTLRRLA